MRKNLRVFLYLAKSIVLPIENKRRKRRQSQLREKQQAEKYLCLWLWLRGRENLGESIRARHREIEGNWEPQREDLVKAGNIWKDLN